MRNEIDELIICIHNSPFFSADKIAHPVRDRDVYSKLLPKLQLKDSKQTLTFFLISSVSLIR